MEYTKGIWEVHGEYNVRLKGTNRGIATTGGYTESHDFAGKISQENSANAKLIVSAVNACIEINPNNPQAVAEAIKDMYEALKLLTDTLRAKHVDQFLKDETLPYYDGYGEAILALAKSEGR